MSHHYLSDLYEPLIQPARTGFASHRLWQFLERPDPVILELFLIVYCALGVRMTEPVESWIRRAGQRCLDIGFPEIGAFLVCHAKQERDHHMLFVADTHWLVDRWNRHGRTPLSASSLLTHPPTPGVERYRAVHEETIEGTAPYGQLAIEYEIERLSVSYGAAAMSKIVRILGDDIVHGLQFLQEHVRQDIAHTALNETALNQLLDTNPSTLPTLVEVGGAAVTAYGEYVNDCLTLAEDIGRSRPGECNSLRPVLDQSA